MTGFPYKLSAAEWLALAAVVASLTLLVAAWLRAERGRPAGETSLEAARADAESFAVMVVDVGALGAMLERSRQDAS